MDGQVDLDVVGYIWCFIIRGPFLFFFIIHSSDDQFIVAEKILIRNI